MLVEGIGEDEDGNPVAAGRTYREAPEVDGANTTSEGVKKKVPCCARSR